MTESENSTECDFSRRKWFTSSCNQIKSIQAPFSHETDTAVLEPDVVGKQWLVELV